MPIFVKKVKETNLISYTPSVRHWESHLWAARVLRNVKKSGWGKVSGIGIPLVYISFK